jgi:hypothetical protein
MRCVNCKKTGTYRPWKGPVELMGVRIEGQGMRCQSCGELLFDADEVRRQERALASALVQRGIRTGREFKLVRKLAELRAAELADMLDVRPERFRAGSATRSPFPARQRSSSANCSIGHDRLAGDSQHWRWMTSQVSAECPRAGWLM